MTKKADLEKRVALLESLLAEWLHRPSPRTAEDVKVSWRTRWDTEEALGLPKTQPNR